MLNEYSAVVVSAIILLNWYVRLNRSEIEKEIEEEKEEEEKEKEMVENRATRMCLTISELSIVALR